MTNWLIAGNNDILDLQQEEELKQNKGLIILIELNKYCEENNVKSIRYSELKRLSNDKLSEFTGGFQTDYGGAFDVYITRYEDQGYLIGDKKSPRRTFIIPDIPKIENVLDKKRLKNSFDVMNVKAIYEKPILTEGLQLWGGILYPHNFSGHLVKHVSSNDEGGSISLLSYPWKIYVACDKDKNFQLSEETIQELLAIGKTIASKDRTMPFKIILEYNGST